MAPDPWLVCFPSTREDAALRALHASVSGMRLCRAAEGPEIYAYVASERDARFLAGHALAETARVMSLKRIAHLQGASWGSIAPWHYVVETDVEAGCEDALNAWYEQEHLPGLAGVPGTVCAMRFLSTADGEARGTPRHHACYHLAARETFGSPSWLAVRATPWSARVRPTFRNTKRTLFRCI